MIIPVVFEGEYQGYIARNTECPDAAKYLTSFKNKDKFVYHVDKVGGKSVCIVEDCLSAIRVGDVMPSVALLGTHVSPSLLALLSTRYTSYYIWTDWDNRDVKLKTLEILKKLKPLGCCYLITTDKDPKAYTTKQIQEEIDNATRV